MIETINTQETSDNYTFIVKMIDSRHRIIRCKDNIQYISQIRTGGNSKRPWRAVSFYLSKAGAARQSPPFQEAARSLFPEDSCRKPSEAARKPVSGSGYTYPPEMTRAGSALLWGELCEASG